MSHKISESKVEVDALSIKEAAEASGLSTVYVRRAILKGDLPSHKEQVGDTSVERHMINVEDFNEWRSNRSSRSRREDGRGKFTLYATEAEYNAITAFLKKEGIASPIGKANKVETIQPVA
jgi:hypothetical protein